MTEVWTLVATDDGNEYVMDHKDLHLFSLPIATINYSTLSPEFKLKTHKCYSYYVVQKCIILDLF